MGQTRNTGRRSAFGLAAVLIIAGGIVSEPSDARAADRGPGRLVYQEFGGTIHSVNADGTDDRTLSQDSRNHGASWSPDGKQILFLRGTPVRSELYVMNRDGSNPHLLRHLKGSVSSASWSPDGKTLALSYEPGEFIPGQLRRAPGFFLLSLDSQDEPRLVRENSWGVKWSPDGKKVVFAENPSPGRWVVHIANADGSNDVPLVTSNIFRNTEGAAWSPDGRRIAFTATTTSREGVFIVNSDGSGVRPLAPYSKEWNCRLPSWSPDGTRIAFCCAAMPACSGVIEGSAFDLAKLGRCIQPIFALSLKDPRAKPVQITKHDGLFPEFAPR